MAWNRCIISSFINNNQNFKTFKQSKKMKPLKTLLILLTSMMFLFSCQRVAPNYAGVLMENYGKAGKSDFSIVTGRVSTSFSPGTELFQVPLWEQRAGYDKESHLKAADNTAFTAKPQYSYRVIKDRAIDVVFDNKQLGSGNEFMKSLEDNILETRMYDIMKEESRMYTTDSLMANGGNLKFEQDVQTRLAKVFEEKGLELIMFSANLDFSEKVKAKIENRNEVNTNVTVIDQQIIEQKKKNELAELQAQENIIRSKGITDEILKQQALDKWNGVLPATITGNASTVMSIPITK